MEERDEEISTLNNKINCLASTIEYLNGSLREKETTISESTANYAKLKEENESVGIQLNVQMEIVSEVKRQNEATNKELNTAKKDLYEAGKEIEHRDSLIKKAE